MTTRAERTDTLMAQIESLGVGTAEYHEAMWMLLSVMARRQAIIAESIRTSQRRTKRAAETRARRRQEALDEFARRELIGEG